MHRKGLCMKLKRVLVLVMALVMIVSACAPSVLAATEATHEHGDESFNGLGLTDKYREIKAVVGSIVEHVEENYDDYYANAYAYVVDGGYVAEAVNGIDLALGELAKIDLDALGATEETRSNLANELGEVVSTLEDIKCVLENGTADNLDGFVTTVLAAVGNAYTHINNLYVINDQLMVDYDREDVLAYVEGIVLPQVEEMIEIYGDSVIDYAIESFGDYYYEALEALDMARDTYNRLVEIVMTVELYVDGTVDALIYVQNALTDGLVKLYGLAYETLMDEGLSFDISVEQLYAVLDSVIDAAIELDRFLENGALDQLDRFIVWAYETYLFAADVLVEAYGDVRNAYIVASKLYNYVFDAESLVALVEQGVEIAAADVYANVVAILNESYEQDGDIYFIAGKLNSYVITRLHDLEKLVLDIHNGALNGDYELTDDSYYVALGNAAYAEALAGKLNLSEKYEVVSLSESYLDKLAMADLVTIKLDNGEFVELIENQVIGVVAEALSSHTELMAWYNGVDDVQNSSAPQEIKDAFVAVKALVDGLIDLETETVELDWNKHLDVEGRDALNALLASVKENLIAAGVPEYYYFDFNSIIDDVLYDYEIGGIVTLSFAPIVIPVADLAVFAVENMIYGYAEMVDDITTVIDNTDATVVLTKINNPLVGYEFYGFELTDYAQYAEPVVSALNANLYAIALTNDNVIFVNSEDADDIYNALTVRCDHVYDDCEDTVCNRCLATRVAPGHTFTNYVFTESDSCKKDGTETAKCDYCDATDTRTVENTKGPHSWKDATCTAPKTCEACGATEGEKRDHEFGDWRLIKDPTSRSEGIEERKCVHCGFAEQRAVSNKALSTLAIVAIVIGGVAVLGGISAGVSRASKKKKGK